MNNTKNQNVVRQHYLDRIMPFMDQPLVKVILGMRRVGKSVFVRQILSALRERGVPETNLVYIDKEDYRFDAIRTYHDLHAHVTQSLKGTTGKAYVFVDEIQEIETWERAVSSWSGHPDDLDIVITGSNANLFSGELATLLSGRHIEFPIFPLAFSEFLAFRQANPSLPDVVDREFAYFLRFGGMPLLHRFDTLNAATAYPALSAILDTVLLKDVVRRHQIRNVRLLENIARYVFDNVGNLFSAHKISQYLKNQRQQVTVETVLGYLGHLVAAGLAHRVSRYDIKGKRHFEVNEKYYAGDIGLRAALLGYRDTDIGGTLENLVYLELLRRGYRVSVGILNGREIDFVADRPSETLYVQVSTRLADAATLERELQPLRAIRDNHPKTILSLDRLAANNHHGIRCQYLPDFLLE